ncbi:MAG: heparinase II/III family protein [Armatimonadia bacterium]
MRYWALCGLLLGSLAWGQPGPATVCFGGFEEGKVWSGGTVSTDVVKVGKGAMRWVPAKAASVSAQGVPTDWSGYDRLSFWLHSAKANGQIITIVATSENPANGKEEWDYYFYHLTVDWAGWRQVTLRKGQELQASRRPLGWDQIQSLTFNSGGWDHKALADTELVLDEVCLSRDPVAVEMGQAERMEGPVRVVQRVKVTGRDDKPVRVKLGLDRAGLKQFEAEIEKGELGPLGSGQTAEAVVTMRLKAGVKAEPLAREAVTLEVTPVGYEQAAQRVEVAATVPLAARPHPRLFLTAAEIAAAKERAGRLPWADAQLKGIISRGEAALKLNCAEIPDRGGQWGHYYVCKTCGVSLKKLDNTHHECPKCKQVYSGWPWDDVIIANIHHSFTDGIERLGLAYAFSGEEKYAEKAREILLAYGEKYRTFPYHDSRGGEARSGGRLYAQTLDESVDIIGVAFGYDLVHDAKCFTAEDHKKIEDGYLREVCRTIQRHDAGISNWQTWHNAGVAAVGFCLDDPELIGWAINGKSGLRFQLKNSVLPDGFWYEGTAGYHFYALDALRYTVEAAYQAGIDFYGDPVYKSLYEGPMQYTFPDGNFPAINDSSKMSISGQSRLYEVAYARFKDPNFAWVAGFGKRGSLEAFLWGVEELPAVTAPRLASKDFNGLGAAVLRVGEGADAAYVHFDYGPHGGGHGHPDKMVVTLYALGQELAPDPGCLAYAAALHTSWYRQSVAHNVIVVDGKSQTPTEGKRELFASWPEAALATGSCGTAYEGVTLKRTVLLTPTYMLDLHGAVSDKPHVYDYVWHNVGTMTPNVAVTPTEGTLGKDAGYQHFTGLQQGSGEKDWSVDFVQAGAGETPALRGSGTVRLTMVGAAGTELYFGSGLAGRPPQPCPMVVARRQWTETLFASVVNFSKTAPDVTAVELVPVMVDGKAVSSQQAVAVKVTRGAAEDWLLVATAAGEKRFGEFTTTARACLVTREGGKVVGMRQVE